MEQELVAVSPAQWPEARSFWRLYGGNPEIQARFVHALLGFRATLDWKNNVPGMSAVDEVIRTFLGDNPECLEVQLAENLDRDLGPEDYFPDDRMLHLLEGILNRQTITSDPDNRNKSDYEKQY